MKRRVFSWGASVVLAGLTSFGSAATMTWDGGGADEDWLTPENWTGDVVPGPGDDVVFDGTSSKNASMSSGTVDINTFTMEPGYGGTLSALAAADIRFRGDFIQNGGTVNWTFAGPLFNASMIVNGGVHFSSSARFVFDGASDYSLEMNAGPQTIDVIDIMGGDGVTATISGMIETDQLFMRDSPNATLEIDGELRLTRYQVRLLNQFGTLVVTSGSVFDINEIGRIDNRDTIVQEPGGAIRGFVRGASFTSANGVPVTSPVGLSEVYVTLIDPDEGIEDLVTETLEVTVQSSITGDTETIVLSEDENLDVTFRNIVPLPVANGVAVPGDGTLQFDGSEELTINYIDNEDPLDTFSTSLTRNEFVWDGGGVDGSWFTPENWSNDVTPMLYDPVRFNGTSTKDCEINAGIVQSGPIVIEAGYTGTVAVDTPAGIGQFHCGGILQQGGTLDMDRMTYRFYGDFMLEGGTTTAEFVDIFFQDAVVATFDAGPNPLMIRAFLVDASPGADVTINGTLALGGSFQITDHSSTVRIADTVTATASFLQMFEGATLIIQDGALLDGRAFSSINSTALIVEEGSGIFRYDAESVAFTDETGSLVTLINPGEDLYVSLVDADESKNPDTVEETSVVVSSDNTGDSETVILQELDTRDHEFRNATGFPTAAGAANSGDGILQHDGFENLTVTYNDDEDPLDMIVAVLQPAPFIWDGGGVDTAWTTAENWDQDAVPGVFDNVIFDATSTKNCVLGSDDITVRNFTIGVGYTGTIDMADCFLNVKGNLLANGGTFDVDNSQLFVSVDADFSGVTFIGNTETFSVRLDDNFDSVVTFPPTPLSIGRVYTATAPTKRVIINGDVTYHFNASFNNGGAVELNGNLTIAGPPDFFRVTRDVTQFFVNDGSVLDLTAASDVFNQGTLIEVGSGVILRSAGAPFVTTATGEAGEIAFGGQFFVTIVDEDENTLGTVIDSLQITVTNADNGDTETIELSETDLMSEEFRNLTGVPVVPGVASSGDGMLQASVGDTVNIDYTDAEDVTDVQGTSTTVKLLPADLWLVR